ncbi:DUF3847 domain-containing protein [Paenibacillus frigoriresistens]|uniref:DUF3847 domain-containing protein n=1 Tax=Paenibacillus alginolyticus TaxID=59839 RepID=UPI001565CA4A|nr:DUF3847 domain-containing protein [Paenibacillus frigoriresistens]NRF95787.1 DUF3847 domain-containing protein [Paenibacillus frigoriresistens]
MSEAKRRSPEEKLAELNKKMEQLKAQKQRVQAQLSQKERKERTRRLIQVGAIFERQFPRMADFTLEQVSELATALGDLVKEKQAAQTAANKEGDSK